MPRLSLFKVSNPYRNILSLKAGYLSNVVHQSFQSLQEYPKPYGTDFVRANCGGFQSLQEYPKRTSINYCGRGT